MSVIIISEMGHTRNKKYTAYYSSKEMMHEINVIIGPGGCFSLFVNVPLAENMPKAVSTGRQNSKKPFLQNLVAWKGDSFLSYQEPAP